MKKSFFPGSWCNLMRRFYIQPWPIFRILGSLRLLSRQCKTLQVNFTDKKNFRSTIQGYKKKKFIKSFEVTDQCSVRYRQITTLFISMSGYHAFAQVMFYAALGLFT